MRKLLAIDPGTEQSAWVVVELPSMRPVLHGIEKNEAVLGRCRKINIENAVIEMVASYGMPVGREVFETCVWIGRFKQILMDRSINTEFVYRKEEKQLICGSMRANDATIKRALIDRFAYKAPNNGKGTKSKPGWFYGFKADIWQAYAVAVTAVEREKEKKNGKY